MQIGYNVIGSQKQQEDIERPETLIKEAKQISLNINGDKTKMCDSKVKNTPQQQILCRAFPKSRKLKGM